MNRNAVTTILAAYALAAVALPLATHAQSQEPPVALNMADLEGAPVHVRERILSEAQKGQTALIQYLHRTQSVHQLRPQLLIKEQQPVWMVGKGETKVAERPADPGK